MSTGYLINNQVIFNHEEHTLRSANSGAGVNIYQINAPASKCFYLLIQNHNTVVTQTELFETVWGQQGAYVSVNTLYQNISLLRKALRALGISDAIKTVSKQGFMLRETISVQSIDMIDDPTIGPDNIDANQERVELALLENEPSIPKRKKSSYILYSLLILLIFIISTLILQRIVNKEHSQHMGYFDNYIKLIEIGGCSVYQPGEDKTNERYLTFVNNNNFICGKNKFIYLTIPAGRLQVSEIICDKKINETGVKCTSYNSYNGLKD